VILALLLYVAAAVLFLLAAIGIPAGRFNLVAAGLFCWVLAVLIGPLRAAT
jgi:hypothetical protein